MFLSFHAPYYEALRARIHEAYPWLLRDIGHPKIRREHALGCLHSEKPSVIVQGIHDMSASLYFRHCDGAYRNGAMKLLSLDVIDKSMHQGADAAAKWKEGVIVNPETYWPWQPFEIKS